MLATLGVGDADALAWLDPPPAAAWGAARELLRRLGAVDRDGRLTDVGRRMSRLPVHPRLARLVVEGEARGVGAAASLAAALIAERDIRAERARVVRRRRPARRAIAARTCSISSICSSRRRRRASARTCCAASSWTAAPPRRSIARAASSAGGGRADRGRSETTRRCAWRSWRRSPIASRAAASRAPATVVLAAGGSAELGYEAAGEWLVAVDAEERSRARAAAQGRARRSSRCAWDRRSSPNGCSSSTADRVEEVDRRAFDPERPNGSNAPPAFATAR